MKDPESATKKEVVGTVIRTEKGGSLWKLGLLKSNTGGVTKLELQVFLLKSTEIQYG
jgi:hypothetical protein